MSKIVKSAADVLGVGNSKDHITTEKYDANQGYLGVDAGDLGKASVVQNPDGSWSKKLDMGANDQARTDLTSGILGDIDPSATGAQDAYYNAQMRLLEPKFERDQKSLDENLINRGIQVGGTQYSNAMSDLLNSQNSTRQNASDMALKSGQDFTASQINNANQLSAGRDIDTLAGLLGENTAYDKSQEALSQRNAEGESYKASRSSNILKLAGL
jgi:hypothetical protein